MKNNRQEKILAIIEAEPIETQEQLLSKLQEQGIESTQATISRDIKQLHLIKEPVDGWACAVRKVQSTPARGSRYRSFMAVRNFVSDKVTFFPPNCYLC